ncbi:hypothetical protein [Bdellovibrio sp. NC01]|uniref:hypothetical protein n=1 Tax=Bdellovibrio sp. NC01 TaxID=2220073 RepID=UPI00115AD5A2|nr:hypothetical protein [Bdellovibrio sp. NC01]QDK37804.1 hypothetical protein DOE51_09510 [Bdellovibrio sp. NC01]
MKKQVLVSLILAGSLVSSFAHAEEKKEASQTANSSTVKVTDVQKKDEQVKDIDDEITNARLRAQLGSKSRWSFKSDFGFNGGSVEKPFDAIRPNYRAGASVETLAVISGNVGVNYRLTEKDNLSAGTGITIMDPFHGDITKPVQDPRAKSQGETVSRYQVSTPFLDWSRGYKAWGMQQVSDITYSHFTDSDSADLKSFGNLALSQTFLADFGASNFSGGVNVAFDYTFYNGDAKDEYLPYLQSGAIMRDDMGFGLFPFAEYTINDTLSLRTVFGYFQFIHYKNEFNNTQDWKQREPYQSVGVGISVTRDIYLYPNIQFTPKDIRADRTNVALSTNINLF